MGRLTIELSEKSIKALERLSEEEETSKVEILRRALNLYDYVQQEVEGGTKGLAILDKSSKTVEKEIVFA